jgi:hypothetical protein
MRLKAFLGFLGSLIGAGNNPAATCSATPPEVKTPSSPPAATTPPEAADAMKELRIMMLTMSASEAGIEPSESFPKVFGVVMDLSIAGGHTATVVSMLDGHASLYTTSTFGVLGGIGHESVRTASRKFVSLAQSHYEAADPTTEYAYPVADHVRFYLLGFEGVRVIDAEISTVEKRNDKHSSMWIAGQGVLTELRLLTEKK